MSSSWRPSARTTDGTRPAPPGQRSARPPARPTASTPAATARIADDLALTHQRASHRSLLSSPSAPSSPVSHSRQSSHYDSPNSPLKRAQQRFAHSPRQTQRGEAIHSPGDNHRSDDTSSSLPGDERVLHRLQQLTHQIASIQAENEMQKKQIAHLLSQRRPSATLEWPSYPSHSTLLSAAPPIAPSSPPLSFHPSPSTLMAHWKRREAALLSDIDDLRSSLERLQQQHQSLLDAHHRLTDDRRSDETERAQHLALAQSTIQRLRERAMKERTRRKMLQGEVSAIKQQRDLTAAHQLRLDSEHQPQLQALEASQAKAQALYEQLLSEQRQHEETARSMQLQLDEARRAKSEAQEAVTQSQSELHAVKRNLEERDGDVSHYQKRIEELEGELKEARDDAAKGEAARRAMQEMIASLETEHRQQQQRLDQLQRQQASTRDAMLSLASLLRLSPPPADTAEQLTLTLRAVEARVDALLASLQEMEAMIEEKTAEVRVYKASMRASTRRVKQLEGQLSEEAAAQRAALHCHQVGAQTTAFLYQCVRRALAVCEASSLHRRALQLLSSHLAASTLRGRGSDGEGEEGERSVRKLRVPALAVLCVQRWRRRPLESLQPRISLTAGAPSEVIAHLSKLDEEVAPAAPLLHLLAQAGSLPRPSPRRLRALLVAPLQHLSVLRCRLDSTSSSMRSMRCQLQDIEQRTQRSNASVHSDTNEAEMHARDRMKFEEGLMRGDAALRQCRVQLEEERTRRLTLEGQLLRLHDPSGTRIAAIT